MRTTFAMLCLFVVTLLAQPLAAQSPDAPLWCMSFYKMKAENLPEWRGMVHNVWMRNYAEYKKAGLVADYGFLTHDYATEWNLITFARFNDYAGVDAFEEKADAVDRAVSPDTIAARALGRAMRSSMIEHFDSFVRPVAGTSLSFSSAKGEKTLWVMSVYRMKLGHKEELEKWLKENWVKVDDQLKKEGTIKDYCYLMHDFGSEWNFVRMTKVTSYADIDKFEKRAGEIEEKMFPDAAKRKQADQFFSDLVFAHFDAFLGQMGQ